MVDPDGKDLCGFILLWGGSGGLHVFQAGFSLLLVCVVAVRSPWTSLGFSRLFGCGRGDLLRPRFLGFSDSQYNQKGE